nr:zinc finger BED domain-containing protein RICESLEEPER 2-like [Tanacetum cinerariifolium]
MGLLDLVPLKEFRKGLIFRIPVLVGLRIEEANSTSTPVEICLKKLKHIPGHILGNETKGCSSSTKNILGNEKLRLDLESEKKRSQALEENMKRQLIYLDSNPKQMFFGVSEDFYDVTEKISGCKVICAHKIKLDKHNGQTFTVSSSSTPSEDDSMRIDLDDGFSKYLETQYGEGWWNQNMMKFPILSQVAKHVLAMPISTIASESAFSTGGGVIDKYRSSLTPKTVEVPICAQDWL